MSVIKRFLCFGAFFAILSIMVMAQELTVEQSYLQESVEMIIIREQSRSNSRDNKLVALEYIDNAIKGGSTSDEIFTTLDYLSLEGIINKTTENGRGINNFPDIRLRAVPYLGQLGTPEARNTLLKVVSSDNEVSVISAAIRALGTIGNNDNNQVTSIIAWTVNRYNILVPDNYLALSALDAFEKIATANKGLTDPLAFETIMTISENYNYITPVRNRARELLNNLLRNTYGQ